LDWRISRGGPTHRPPVAALKRSPALSIIVRRCKLLEIACSSATNAFDYVPVVATRRADLMGIPTADFFSLRDAEEWVNWMQGLPELNPNSS
jgi:hypothetical protein